MDGSTDLRSAFAELVDDAPCGIVVTDPDGRLRFVNETLKRWLNNAAGADHRLERLPDLLTGPGKLFYETHLAPMMRLQGFAREIACSLHVTKGDPMPVLLSGVVRRDQAGTLVRFDYTIFDARERHLYEKELRTARRKADELAAIVRTSPNAILRVDEAGLIRSWNGGAEALLGKTAEAALDVPVQDVIRFDDHPNWFCRAVERCKDAPNDLCEVSDEKGRHFEVTIVPIIDQNPAMSMDYSVIRRDVTARKRAEQRLRVTLGEMKHRLKNTLAVVGGIARQTLPTEVRDAFIGRLHALSRAHDVLADEDQKRAGLRDLLELTAAEAGGTERFRISGPSAILSPEQARSLSMALHELATNALKYGALSVPAGYVEVGSEWLGTQDGTLRVVWHERNGPPVSAPTHHGFGSTTILNLLKIDLQGDVSLDYRTDGLRFEVVIKLDGE